MPPATEGTVLCPAEDAAIPQPTWYPASRLVEPTSLLKENNPPGGTTTPFKRDAASWILCFFGGRPLEKLVRELSMRDVIPSFALSSTRTAAGATDTGRWSTRSGPVSGAVSRSIVAGRSNF